MERKVVKKLSMLLRILNSKKFRTAKRGAKLEKVEALAAKRIMETKPILEAKLVELNKAEEEKLALNDLQDLCENLKDFSKGNIATRVTNLMAFFGIPQPGESPRKKKGKKEGTSKVVPATLEEDVAASPAPQKKAATPAE